MQSTNPLRQGKKSPSARFRPWRKVMARYMPINESYRALACLGAVSLATSLAYAVINQSAMPPYIQEIGLTPHVGLVYAAFLVLETLFKSPMGSLGDRLGRKPLLVGGGLISACMAVGITMTKKLWALVILCGCSGIAAAAIWPTVAAAISGTVGRASRTSGMSVMTVTYMAGLALGPLVGGLANDLTNSRLTSFYVGAVLFLTAAALALILTPRQTSEEAECDRGRINRSVNLRDLLVGLGSIPDLMLVAFLAFFGIGLIIPIAKLFAMNQVGLSETEYGSLFLPIALAIALLSLVSGKIGDKWGKARSVRLGIALSAAGMLALTISIGVWQLTAAAALLGVGFVLAMPAWLAFVSDITAPRVRGAVIGALGTAQGVGAVFGAGVGSYLYKMAPLNILGLHIDSHRTPFAVSALALTTCIMLAFAFIREGDTRRIGYSG